MSYEYVERFRHLGFGMFVHFGLYSTVGKGEWYLFNNPKADKDKYNALPTKFKIKPDWAKQLVSTAKQAGCKYITLTTRHHDGFSLYDTCGLNEFDAPHSATGRDLVREFVDECNKQGILPMFYHTLLDWHHPDYNANFDRYQDYLIKSVELLCTNYGKIGGLWFDGFWDKPKANWRFDELYATIRKHQPEAMIINNTGMGDMGRVSHEQIDSVTFERGTPNSFDAGNRPRAGEMCDALNDHWGYTKDDICFKPITAIIDSLVACRQCNCNFLLNVGPTANGYLTPLDKQMFQSIGKWITFNKGFIYDAHGTDITADNATILSDGEHYYAVISQVPMFGNIYVAREEALKLITIHTDRKVVNARYLDNGKSARVSHNSFRVEPFWYGVSLHARVVKFDLN